MSFQTAAITIAPSVVPMQGAGRGGAGKGTMATGEVEVFVHGPGAKPQVVAASRTAPWIIDEIHRYEISTPATLTAALRLLAQDQTIRLPRRDRFASNRPYEGLS